VWFFVLKEIWQTASFLNVRPAPPWLPGFFMKKTIEAVALIAIDLTHPTGRAIVRERAERWLKSKLTLMFSRAPGTSRG
jgi:hypothetical protein